MIYSEYLSELRAMAVADESDTDFTAIIPAVIDYAEGRCYRDLDLLSTVVRDATGTLTQDSRNFALPTPSGGGPFVVVNGINVITPAGTAADSGTRNPLTPVSRDALDLLWPSATGAGLPTVFAMIDQGNIIVGPAPDAGYVVEVVGTHRPTALSDQNTETFLTLYLPDLFVAASMIFVAGYQKNFGAQADDARSAQSWEGQYKTLLASADVEEARIATSFSKRSLIENAKGSQGQDNILGNELSNNIYGNAGDDAIRGQGGTDYIYGEAGTDTAYFNGTRAEFYITDWGDGSYTVSDLVSDRDGSDYLSGVERVAFSDGTYYLADLFQ